MAGFLSLPSKELAQERRRNCNPFLIAASGFITGLIYPIFAFRHRNKNILISWLSIAAFIVIWRQFFELEPGDDFFYNPVTSVIGKTSNFFIYSKYGPSCAHFISIFFFTYVDKGFAKQNFLKPLQNEKDAFPLRVRKTTSILKNIFDIDNEKAKDIYDGAKPSEGGLPTIDDLNWVLLWEKLEPVQFCKKDGLKIIPKKLRANLEKTPSNKSKSKAKKKDLFAFFNKKIFLYPIGIISGIFISHVAKEVISNLISN